MKRCLMVGMLLIASAGAHAERRYQPELEVNVPQEAFTRGEHRPQPCSQCCIYENRNYSQGAVIKVEGLLLQCLRDERAFGTNPLVWRRVTS